MPPSKPKVSIINYGVGNVISVYRAFLKSNCNPVICSEGEDLFGEDAIVLPGVGSFTPAMKSMVASGVYTKIIKQIEGGTPILGICLGLQLLGETSEEGDGTRGFGFIKGNTKKLAHISNESPRQKQFNVGWKQLVRTSDGHNVFSDINDQAKFYFVHGYHF